MAESRRIEWRCDLCGEPLNDGFGRVFINEDAVREVHRAWRDFEREHTHPEARVVISTMAERMALPEAARWEFRHHACDPAPDRHDYWFDVADVRTEAALLTKTAHLMEKDWLTATNWDAVIARAGAGGP